MKSIWARSLLWAFAVLIAFYVLQLLALMLRFQELPNYLNYYDWLDNVIVIFRSTPSLRDSLMILQEEWWIEVGYMNTDFGLGISEWSLYLAPAKMLSMYAIFFLVVFNILLILRRKRQCSWTGDRAAKGIKGLFVANGIGTALVAVTSITMSWVVCCATPTWIVGLAMLGLGVTASLQLEALGIWLYLAGVVTLLAIALLQVQWFLSTRKAEQPAY